jgi:hypothetical protein
VLTSLSRLPGGLDPYFGENVSKIKDASAAGVGEYTFWYLHEFELASQPPPGGSVRLEFRGVNYTADVFVNGAEASPASAPLTGMFLRHVVDITTMATSGTNRLAVRATPPDPPGNPSIGHGRTPQMSWPSSCQGGDAYLGRSVTAQYSGGWDFVAPLADRNAGIWDKVFVRVTGPAVIHSDPQLTSTVTWSDGVVGLGGADGVGSPSVRPTKAAVTITVPVRNRTAEPLSIAVAASVGRTATTRTTTVPALGTDDVTLRMTLRSPRLWWPNGSGAQHLYPVRIRVSVAGVASDSYTSNLGIREISSAFDPNTAPGRVFTVNRTRLFIRGGAWTFGDAALRLSDQNYDDQVRLHQMANLNLIRIWGGGLIERPEFYDACDRYGLLVWQEFPVTNDCLGSGQNPANPQLLLASARDAILMLRNHPCLALWVGGNEGKHAADRRLAAAVRDLDPKTDYVSFSTDPTAGFGRDGPYGIQYPANFFGPNSVNTTAFNPEYGSVGFPVSESLSRFMTPQDAAYVPVLDQGNFFSDLREAWWLHNFQPFFNATTVIDQAMLYGVPATGERYCEQAQAAQYQQYQALVEGLNQRMWTAYTGGNIWRSQCGWPGLRGGLYDVYLEPTGGLFGVRKAAAPIAIQLELNSFDVAVINNTGRPLSGLTVDVTVCDSTGRLVPARGRSIRAPRVLANSRAVAGNVAEIIDRSEVQFVATTLRRGRSASQVLATNFDWIADPTTENAYASIRALPRVTLRVAGTGSRHTDGTRTVELSIANPTDTIAFFNRIRVLDAATHEPVQPVFATDGYLSVLPGTSASVALDFRYAGADDPKVTVEGWNASGAVPGSPDNAVPIRWRGPKRQVVGHR